MKQNKLKITTLAMISLLSLCGCNSNQNVINRAKAIEILDKINETRNSSGFTDREFTSFMISNEYSHLITTNKNSCSSSLNEETNSIMNSNSVITSDIGTVNTNLFRYSANHRYSSMRVVNDDGSYVVTKVYFNKYNTDTKEFLYQTKTTYSSNGAIVSDTWSRIEDPNSVEFNKFIAHVRTKGLEVVNKYNDVSTAKEYFSSLPEILSEGNNEDYLSLGEGSVYLRASGNDGTPVSLSKFNLQGTQDLYFTRFTDNICVSSFCEANNNNEKTYNETLKLSGGMLSFFPVVEGSVSLTINLDDQNTTFKDNGEGAFIYEDGRIVDNSYIDYSTGEFFVFAKSASTIANYKYTVSDVSYDKYACSFSEFVPTDHSLNPATSNATQVEFEKY